MSNKDNFRSTVREALIANSNIRPVQVQMAGITRTVSKTASMNQAIAVRRAELNNKGAK